MNCKECQSLLNKYLDGGLEPEAEQAIQAHLDSCPSCQQLLDSKIVGHGSETIKPPKPIQDNLISPALEEEKQARILRNAKYKHCFLTAFSVIMIVFLFQIVGTFVSSLYYNFGGENSRLYRTQKTAILLTEFNMPNVQIPVGMHSWPGFFSQVGWGHSNLQIKPYLAARGSYALEKTIGKETYPIGSLNINFFFISHGYTVGLG